MPLFLKILKWIVASPDYKQYRPTAIPFSVDKPRVSMLIKLRILSEVSSNGMSQKSDPILEAAKTMTNAEWRLVVDMAYQSFLGRSARADEYELWSELISVAEPIQTLKASVEGSEEARIRREGGYIAKRQEQTQVDIDVLNSRTFNISKSDWSDVVVLAYSAFLGREPSADEIAYWNWPLSSTAPVPELLTGIKNSIEAINREHNVASSISLPDKTVIGTISDLSDSDWKIIVELVYFASLGRHPSENEYVHWDWVRRCAEPVRTLSNAVVASGEFIDREAGLSGQQLGEGTVSSPPDGLNGQISDIEWRNVVDLAYQAFLGRQPNSDEYAVWSWPRSHINSTTVLAHSISNSQEAKDRLSRNRALPSKSDGEFVVSLYNIILNRGPLPAEIEHWDRVLRTGSTSRETILSQFFNERVASDERPRNHQNNPSAMAVLGTTRIVTKGDWDAAESLPKQPTHSFERFPYTVRGIPRVSILTSLYCGARYIDQFISNMLEQTIFADCELIIIDAASPEEEYDRIKDIIAGRSNIIYRRLPERIGIYSAWNLAIELSSAPYITNANLDDLRRRDSFELQAATLDALPFVDIVYQDFLISFEENISFDKIELHNLRSNLPIVNPNNLMSFNSPHNAPMWRREIHKDVGIFDPTFRSAGDYDFWLRCVAAKKIFYKINDPHVSYYVNPHGLSTNSETVGVAEAHRVYREIGPLVISPYLTQEISQFLTECRLDKTFGTDNLSRYEIAQAALLALRR